MDEVLSAQSLLDAAAAAAARGDVTVAEATLREALALQEASLGPVHGDLVATLNNLAVVCEWLDQPDEAERLYLRAHLVADSLFAPEHPDVATTRRNFEDFRHARGLSADFGFVSTDTEGIAGMGSMKPPAIREPAAVVATDAAPTRGRPAGPPVMATTARRGGAVRPRWGRLSLGMMAGAAVVVVAAGAAILLRASSARTSATPVPTASDVPSAAPPAVSARADAAVRFGDARAEGADVVGREHAERVEHAVTAPASASTVQTTAGFTREPVRAGGVDPTPVGEPAARATTGSKTPVPAVIRDSADAPLKVVTARLCQELTRGPGGWDCRTPDERMSAGPLYFYTRIAAPSGADVEHLWYRGDTLIQRVSLRIAASGGEGYRTFSRQTVRPESGAWRVELRAGDLLLDQQRFAVP